MTIARRVVVSGRVQGVFFRAWTREQAALLGVSGWVRNRPDGAVEALVEGDADAVEAMVQRLHRGPSKARVDLVESDPIEATGERGFTVRA